MKYGKKKKPPKVLHHGQVRFMFIPGSQGCFNIFKSIGVIHHINKWKDKIHVTVSIDVKKKSTGQNSTFIHDKNSHQSWYQGNMIKVIYDKPTANVILNTEKLKILFFQYQKLI